jgi:hypothetical protein
VVIAAASRAIGRRLVPGTPGQRITPGAANHLRHLPSCRASATVAVTIALDHGRSLAGLVSGVKQLFRISFQAVTKARQVAMNLEVLVDVVK